jgi:biotin carboxyl carrier protein
MKIYAESKDHTLIFEQSNWNGMPGLLLGGKQLDYEFIPLGNNRFSLLVDHVSHHLHIVEDEGRFHIHLDGAYFSIRVEDERMRALRELVAHSAAAGGDQTVVAPIPGLISRILVSPGQRITDGEPLVILEAMKMENEIRAETGGIVKEILVETGRPVEKDLPLLVISRESTES